MKKIILQVTLKRLKELLGLCIVLSAVVSLLCVMGLLPDKSRDVIIGLNVAAVIFMLINFMQMRRCYYELRNNTSYYIANICAYFTFALLNLCAYKLCSGEAYTWMFAITKIFRYTRFYLATWLSAVIFHCVMLGWIFISTVGMGWIYAREAERKAKIAALPPKLTVNPLEPKDVAAEVSTNEKNESKKENTLS